jgi:hypothetical protein
MPDRFPVGIPLEVGWTRRVLCAAEIVDAVTLQPVRNGIEVRARGLKRKPHVNFSGFHVWLEEADGAQPERIVVDALDTHYSSAESPPPVPPQKAIRIELAPQFEYPFPHGATALRGTLRESRFGPPKPIVNALVRLQWFNTDWVDAATAVTTNEKGDFAAPLRLAPGAEPKLDGANIAVRLRVQRDGTPRTTEEFGMAPGKVTPAPRAFIWDDLNP